MSFIRLAPLAFGIIVVSVLLSAQNGLLGIYGTPGDTYHLIILTAVLFALYLSVAKVVDLKGEPEA